MLSCAVSSCQSPQAPPRPVRRPLTARGYALALHREAEQHAGDRLLVGRGIGLLPVM